MRTRILFIFGLVMVMTSCFKSEEEILLPGASKGAVIPEIVSVESSFFDEGDKSNTFVKFTINVDDESASEVKLQISVGGLMQRKDYGSYTSFPVEITLPLTEVASALGIGLNEIKGGDVVNIEILVKAGGSFYRSNVSLNPLVACEYDPSFLSGTYDVSSASWASSGTVTLTADPTDPYKIEVVGLAAMDGLTEDQGPLVFIVNPADYSVTAPKATLATSAWGYDNFSYESASPGTVNTCDGTYKMAFTITVDQGSFGTYGDYVFTKR